MNLHLKMNYKSRSIDLLLLSFGRKYLVNIILIIRLIMFIQIHFMVVYEIGMS